ncbi:GTPase activating protein for Arf [Fonsecaea pedrosoi]|nr:GTPase activating protein for Arf [Fonsecaea pedrosoi]
MASMSKRTQARNERELHELLSVAGNSQCADCGAKNPAWASWNLGVFLCMRCASLHRKLGTHISKVKSLSMDTWSTEQVENMRRNGNTAVNKIYNPKNKMPDMPFDVDEVDSAMERFIRKKYQEKSLSDGRPEPPQRDDNPPSSYSRPQGGDLDSPPPPLPPKKGKFFGFGLRASSSAYSLSKHDKKKHQKEPRVDSTFRIPTGDYDSRMDDARFEMTDAELQTKLATLRDMGFSNTDRNTNLLRRLNGNVERTIEALVQLGPSENGNTASSRRQGPTPTASQEPTPKPQEPSYNPFTSMNNQQTVGLSLAKPQEPSTPTSGTSYNSNNPYAQPNRSPSQTGLEQSFQSMQVSQPLFPHSTGGYPSQPPPLQDPRFQYSMTPPVTSTQFQQGYVASPAAIPVTSNPFFQPTPVSAQSTGNNPFLSQCNNDKARSQQVSIPSEYRPPKLPPLDPVQQPQLQQPQDLFGTAPQNQPQPNNPFQQQGIQQQQQQQQYSQAMNSQIPQTQSPFANFQYTQQQIQPQQQTQSQSMPMSPPQVQQQPPYSQPQFSQQNQQPMVPQQTGRYDKSSILALYNYPQLALQPLASIPEPASEQQQPQQQPQQPVSYSPSGDIFGNNHLSPAKRSATMPVSLSNMHSAGGSGNRNPFMTNVTNTNLNTVNTNGAFNPFGGAGANPFGSPHQGQVQVQVQAQTQTPEQSFQGFAQQQSYGQAMAMPGGMGAGMGGTGGGGQRPQQGIAARHASAESMSINNLEAGRHSPDAFANLSARYMR